MKEEDMDELTRLLREEYNAPPPAPREEMWATISVEYPFTELKGLDWQAIHDEIAPRVQQYNLCTPPTRTASARSRGSVRGVDLPSPFAEKRVLGLSASSLSQAL